MAIKVGDKLPEGTLTEFVETERPGCTVGPNAFQVSDLTKGKKIVIFGLPGAFTPTCSAKHVPSYVQNIDKLKAKGVDEVWCRWDVWLSCCLPKPARPHTQYGNT